MKPARTHLLSFRGWFAVVFLDNIHMDIAANMSVCLHSSAKWNIITHFFGTRQAHLNWKHNFATCSFVTLCCRLQSSVCKLCGLRGKNISKNKQTPQDLQKDTKRCTLILNILNMCFMDANLCKGTKLQQSTCKLLSQGSFCVRFYFSVQTIESGMLKKVDDLCCFDLFRALRQDRGTQHVRITATCDSR